MKYRDLGKTQTVTSTDVILTEPEANYLAIKRGNSRQFDDLQGDRRQTVLGGIGRRKRVALSAA